MFLKPDELEAVRQLVVVRLGGGPGAMCLFELIRELDLRLVDGPPPVDIKQLIAEELDRRFEADLPPAIRMTMDEITHREAVMLSEQEEALRIINAAQEEVFGRVEASVPEREAEDTPLVLTEPGPPWGDGPGPTVEPSLVLNPVPGFAPPAPVA